MKRTFIYLVVSFFIYSCQNTKQEKSVLNDIYSIGGGEGVMSRNDYELLRQKNPNTGEIPNNILAKEYKFVNNQTKAINDFNLTWQPKGPINVGGRTRALAIDTKNDSRILAGGVSGGLWISENGGASFVKVTNNTISHSITSIAQDTRVGHENTWYYGTGELSGNSADLNGLGIFKSTDNGITWSLLPSTENDSANDVSALGDFKYVSDVKVNPTNGDVVAATFAGIFLSQNGGATWQNVLTADNSPNGFNYYNFGNQTSVDVDRNGVYYATLSSDAQDKGIWRSLDGISWVNITPTGFTTQYRRMESAVNPLNQNEVLFIVDASTDPFTDNHELWHYTYLSGNGSGVGAMWQNRTANLPDEDCLGFYDFNFGYYQSQSSYDMCIKYHPTISNLVFLGGTNLYRSTDAFTTDSNYEWIGGYQCDVDSPSNYVWPNHHPDNHDIVFLQNNPNVMISAHDGGMSKTQNCVSGNPNWESINNGYGTTQFYTIAIEPGNVDNNILIGGLQDNGTWHTMTGNPNLPWISTFYGDGAYCAIAENRTAYYVSWQGGKTFKFDIDDNGNINGLTRIDPPGATDFMFINPFILDPTNNNTMYMTAGRYLWRNDSLSSIPILGDEYTSTSIGWQRIDESYTTGIGFSTPFISAINMSKANSDILYYGTINGQLLKLTGLDNGSYVKENIRASTMPSGAYVSSICASNINAQEVLVSYSNYEVQSVFYTTDGGTTWENVSGNLEEFIDGSGSGPSVNWVHIYQDNTDTLYFAGTTSGLYITDALNGDSTIWQREALNVIGNVPVAMITSRPYDKNIVVATHGNGVFSTKVVDVNIRDVQKENDYAVSFPYPNPASDRISLKFYLNNKSQVKAEVYNTLGAKIETIEQGSYNAGEQKLRWEVSNYTAGMYLLVVEINGKAVKRKFLVKD
ncbi:MAG: T9SS type A sorting domain-containing protein [Chitinophagales bacterium]|nr:T9SS type A sorting domain-containing protein [Chitinophagales bacterium]